jgi:riboflavin biosynthesis pyrimidine reductase
LRTPLNAKLRTAGKRPIIFHSKGLEEQVDADCIFIEKTDEGLNLEELAKILVERGIYSVLLEGGAIIHQAFMKKGWIDRIELFQAPIILGEGKKWFSSLPFHLNLAPNFELLEVSSYSSDVHLCYEQRRKHV